MEQSIRVSARGEFGQLNRGLKQLRGDLKNVTDEISRGARKGGIFDESQLRALDLFKKRFSETLREIDREFEKQNKIVDELYEKLEKAQQSERDSIRKTIQDREKQLDVLRRQIIEQEKLFELQSKQVGAPTSTPKPPAQPGGGSAAPGGGNGGSSTGGGNTGGSSSSQGGSGSSSSSSQGTAEFQALRRGIKQLEDDLKSVNDVVSSGARQGGIFDDKQVKALDLFRRRFQETYAAMDEAMTKQADAYEEIYEKIQKTSGAEQEALRKELEEREKVLESMDAQIRDLEKIYSLRVREANTFGRTQAKSTGSSYDEGGDDGAGSSRRKSPGGGLLSGVASAGKFALGMAGIGSIVGLVSEAYQLAYAREVNSLDLAQRMRGQNGWNGSNTAQFDQASEVGRRDRMGYTSEETWNFLDQYTRQAGTITTDQQFGLMKFGRAYGLSTGEVAGLVGSNQQIGGSRLPKEFADSIAGSVASSGMTPRILEVMETNNALLQQMNTTLKDGSARQILAYQTTLDKIGLANDMKQLTGAQGANLIGGLGGIFTPGEDNWKWMGIRALQAYNPDKYGNMDLFDLEQSYEDGLMNADNIPAMAEYIRSQTGGNQKLEKRIMQRWLTDGGFAATKREASEFYDATNGLRAFSPDQIEAMKNGSLDSGAKYDEEREGLKGQGYMDTDARFLHALEQIGRPILETIMTLKETVTTGMEQIIDAIQDNEVLKKIYEFMQSNLKGLMLAAGGLVIANNILKIISAMSLMKGFGGGMGQGALMAALTRFGIPAALVATGTFAAVEGFEAADQFVKDGGFGSKDLAKRQYAELNGIDVKDVPDWITHPAQLDMERSSRTSSEYDGKYTYYKEDPRWLDTREGKEAGAYAGMTSEEKKQKLINGGGNVPSISDQKAGQIADYLKGINTPTSTDFGLPSTLPNALPKNPLDNLIKTNPWKPSEGKPFQLLSPMLNAGDSDIGKMSEEDYQRFINMPKKVTTDVGTMSEEGSDFFSGATKEHKDKLQQIYNEHRGLKEVFTELFDPVIEGFKFVFTSISEVLSQASAAIANLGASGGGEFFGGGGAGAGFDVRGMGNVTAEQLNQQLGGVLAGRGQEFIAAGYTYGMNPAFLAALAMHETGNGTSNAARTKNNVGGMMGKNGLMSFSSISSGITSMASNLKRNYLDQGLYTVADIQQKYAPIGASNDPTGLNNNWISGVSGFMNKMGVATGGGNGAGGGDFFKGWEDRVTSRYGSFESFRKKPHGGLDINGEQGDELQALFGGKISFIKYDDGSKLDEDGKANTRPGGTELGVKMADGSTYFYSHLSKVAAGLKVGDEVQAGQYVGNVGGGKGKDGKTLPGGGSSTTGSHLHLGYMDTAGNLMNPEQLMRQLNMGDSDIGKMMSQLPLENRQQMEQQTQSAPTTINVNITGSGAKELNQMTNNQLRNFIKQVFTEEERKKLLMSPVKAGYGR